ncbi:MAG TPA: glycosyltransferase [Thermoleophilaceae bacterium]
MSVLVVTNLLPAGRSGGEIVTRSVVDALRSAGRDVRVLGYRRTDDRAPEAGGEVCVGRRPAETAGAGARALGWGARAVAGRAPYSAVKWRSRAYARAVEGELRERPEVVIVDHAGLEVVIPPSEAVAAPTVFVAHNAEGEMYGRLAAEARGPLRRWPYAREARLIRGVEARLVRRARQTWALTEDDASYLRGLDPAADVRTLDVASSIDAPAAAPEPGFDVAAIGTWSWHANARGLEWFADEVVPLLPAGTTVEVAGRGADWLRGRHPGVAVRGMVPDALEFMSRARVVAVPSVTGGGVQIKTLDAIASGVPVVATAVATRGLDDLPGSVAVAPDPEAFAAELVRLAAERDRERLRAEALAWTRARRERLGAAVAAWVAELATGGARAPARAV